MLVGVGQRRAAGRVVDAQMHQATHAAGQAVADFAQGVGATQPAEDHRDELGPASKALGGALSAVLLNECGELAPGKLLERFIEQAGCGYDCLALLVGASGESSGQANVHRRSIIGAPFLGLIKPDLSWTKVNAKWH